MTSYRPIVGWLNVALGALTLVPTVLLPLVLGGVWSIAAVRSRDARAMAVTDGTFGAVLVVATVVLLALSVVSLAAGYGVLKGRRWGEVLCIVASALHLLNFPVGVALGAFSLWVLLVREPASRPGLPRLDPDRTQPPAQ